MDDLESKLAEIDRRRAAANAQISAVLARQDRDRSLPPADRRRDYDQPFDRD